MVLSFPLWGAAFLVAPFLPLPGEQRAMLAALFLLVAEGIFWLGALYLGADVVARFRRRFSTRRSVREQESEPGSPQREQSQVAPERSE